MKCPNCGHEQPDGQAECGGCRLIFGKWRPRPSPPAAGSGQPPFFQGLACMTWSPNRLYRVYVLPGELAFVWAATGSEMEKVMGAQFGLLGALAASALTTSEEENARRKETLDRGSLDQIIADNEHNFRAPREDFLEASLEPRSLWLAFAYGQMGHKGVFRFRHREKGKMALCLPSEEDVRRAAVHLSTALGGLLRVEVGQ
ncbi:MAG: hypothetical protein HY550_02960 [Elusimicrobia bacterium]|nr:hypothetical protein [Elusimicrobiota bacterium]